MAWQDRPYYRDSSQGSSNPLMWLLTGSVPLFTAFGIRVRMHASLLISIALILLLGWGPGFTLQDRLIGSAALFVIILLHEFGHCFAARSVGGHADQIIMHPFGGLALAQPPRRWWPTFVTVAGGPLVNVVICLVLGAALWAFFRMLPWNPFQPTTPEKWDQFAAWGRWIYWAYWSSWMLLIFNLLPIFPLDGGQILQSLLWPKFGYYKSMMFACTTGMVGAVLAGLYGLVTGSFMLLILAALGFIHCLNMRRVLVAEGPWGFQEEDGPDYSASLFTPEPAHATKHRKLNKRVLRRAQKREAAERAEQERVDHILAKVSAHGMTSLSFWEKRTLKRATDRQRKRDLELREEMKSKGF